MNKNIEKLHTVENGRFKRIIEALNIADVCFDCSYFNYKCNEKYRCNNITNCIGGTLSKETKSYLLWKLDLITEEEHLTNLGIRIPSKQREIKSACLRCRYYTKDLDHGYYKCYGESCPAY